MVLLSDEYESDSFRAGEVFTPATPVSTRHLFSGRDYQLHRVIDLIFAPGQHAVIYGERGVGKTSLANILHEVLEPGEPGRARIFSRVNCDSDDTFSSVWKKAMENVSLLITKPSLGFAQEAQKQVITLAEIIGAQQVLTVNDIKKIATVGNLKFVFIFDEFDRITDTKASTLFADTIKTLSDFSLDITLVLIGVADNISKLIKEHASIDRSLVQILMPRMKAEEIQQIFVGGFAQLNMTINPSVLSSMVGLCQGLPHYAHLIGLASVRRALKDKRRQITDEDFKNGIKDAIVDAQHSIIQAYNKAITSPRKDTLFKEVLLACALCPIDELGYFAPADVRNPLERILGHKVEISSYNRHLAQFCAPKHGETLCRKGEKRHYRFRFVNPLLQPYIIFRGIEDGLWKV